MPNQDDVLRLAEQLVADMSAQQRQSFLAALLADGPASLLDAALRTPQPTVRRAPAEPRGFRVRLDLLGAKPPVWRRLELPGHLTLDELHLAIQASMGWFGGHLHRFRTGSDQRSPYFVTPFDLEEGTEDEDGVLEDEVRMDQVLAGKGDRLWYEYDFGDGWEHVLAVEAVIAGTVEPRCTAGRMACPPEDCGGIWSYLELVQWVRDGFDETTVPSLFESADHAREWLPLDWHPERFDVEEASTALRAALGAAPENAPEEAPAAPDSTVVDLAERRGARRRTTK